MSKSVLSLRYSVIRRHEIEIRMLSTVRPFIVCRLSISRVAIIYVLNALIVFQNLVVASEGHSLERCLIFFLNHNFQYL